MFAGDTRFATAYLMCARLKEMREDLIRMVQGWGAKVARLKKKKTRDEARAKGWVVTSHPGWVLTSYSTSMLFISPWCAGCGCMFAGGPMCTWGWR
jgi:hypothetical protein